MSHTNPNPKDDRVISLLPLLSAWTVGQLLEYLVDMDQQIRKLE